MKNSNRVIAVVTLGILVLAACASPTAAPPVVQTVVVPQTVVAEKTVVVPQTVAVPLSARPSPGGRSMAGR